MFKLINLLADEGHVYLFLFTLLYVFVFFDFLFTRKTRLFFSLISLILLIVISGFRFEVGTDWEAYKDLFDNLELDWSFLINVFNFDFGYVLFNALFRLFTDSYVLFLLVDSLVALGFIGWIVFKYSPLPNLSLFLFYNTYFISTYMGSNRRIIAIGFSLISLIALIEMKKTRMYLNAFIAFLFHRTSFVILIARYLPTKLPKLKQIIIGLIISFIIGLFQIPFKFLGMISDLFSQFDNIPLVSKLIFYSDIDNNKAVISDNLNTALLFTFSTIKRSFLISLFYYVIHKKGANDPYNLRLFVIYWFGFMGYMVFNGTPIFQILFVYFSIVEVILVGRIVNLTNFRFKLSLYLVLLVYGVLQLLSALTAYPELYIPYKSAIHF
jgi:hypothetical protein